MTRGPETSVASHARVGPPAAARRIGTTVLLALTSLCLCAADGPTTCGTNQQSIGPSGGEVAGVIVGAAAIGAVLIGSVILIDHSHHTVKGCVLSGPNGLEVQTQNDKKTYALTGDTANIKVGDLVQFHGNKVKRVKHSTDDQTFAVQKISKDFGPCNQKPLPPSSN